MTLTVERGSGTTMKVPKSADTFTYHTVLCARCGKPVESASWWPIVLDRHDFLHINAKCHGDDLHANIPMSAILNINSGANIAAFLPKIGEVF